MRRRRIRKEKKGGLHAESGREERSVDNIQKVQVVSLEELHEDVELDALL